MVISAGQRLLALASGVQAVLANARVKQTFDFVHLPLMKSEQIGFRPCDLAAAAFLAAGFLAAALLAATALCFRVS